ncbi:GD17885 [Drosophila simulans]|uniref:GD17885 n=1 Tax=Drosophila simulans TaxID=7240 RepID=B4QG91_DROSI|nr:GD17885 [Drosophila simulans]
MIQDPGGTGHSRKPRNTESHGIVWLGVRPESCRNILRHKHNSSCSFLPLSTFPCGFSYILTPFCEFSSLFSLRWLAVFFFAALFFICLPEKFPSSSSPSPCVSHFKHF